MPQTLQLTQQQIGELADAHIERYTGMLDCGHPSVNVAETTAYRKIWLGIKGKTLKAVPDFAQQEIGEIEDAVFCGDYESIVPCPESVCRIEMP